jgi:Arc/MetJ-type ribon-helix-helix transcriptional regulator
MLNDRQQKLFKYVLNIKMRKRAEILVGAKFGPELHKALENYITLDTHTTKSEFIRDAVRRELEERAKELGLSIVELARLPPEKLQRKISRRIG